MQNQNPEVQIIIALLYHPKISQNAGSLKALRLSSIAHSPPKTLSTVSSAGGGQMNDTDQWKDKGRETKNEEKSREMKGSKEAGLCVHLCVFVNTSHSLTLKNKPRETFS